MINSSLLRRMKLSDWNLICIVVDTDFIAFIFIGLFWISCWLIILLQVTRIRSILDILVFNMLCDLRSLIKISIGIKMFSRFLSWIIIDIMIIDIEIISMDNKFFLLKTRRKMLILLKIVWNISIRNVFVFIWIIIEKLIFCHWWKLLRLLLLIEFFSLFYVEFRIFLVRVYVFDWLIIGACYVLGWIYLRLSMIFMKALISLIV